VAAGWLQWPEGKYTLAGHRLPLTGFVCNGGNCENNDARLLEQPAIVGTLALGMANAGGKLLFFAPCSATPFIVC